MVQSKLGQIGLTKSNDEIGFRLKPNLDSDDKIGFLLKPDLIKTTIEIDIGLVLIKIGPFLIK